MQVENEFGPMESVGGSGAKPYANWAAKMAVATNTGVPWVMCKQEDAPDPVVHIYSTYRVPFLMVWLVLNKCVDNYMLTTFPINSHLSGSWQINTCNGFYCDYFTPNKKNKPAMWTEAWTGW